MKLRSDLEIMRSSLAAGYVGGGYYNPINEFVERARLLESQYLTELCKRPLYMETQDGAEPTFHVAHIYKELTSLAKSGEVIFGMYEKNNQYKFAVQITNEERLMDFEGQVCFGGVLKRHGFFVLDSAQANEGLIRDFVPPEFT